ncbi:MAG: hypothetical protein WCL60_16520 [Methylococcales bacterium]
MRKKIIPNVREEDIKATKKIYEDDGCTTTSEKKQPDGLWTIELLCPEGERQNKLPTV